MMPLYTSLALSRAAAVQRQRIAERLDHAITEATLSGEPRPIGRMLGRDTFEPLNDPQYRKLVEKYRKNHETDLHKFAVRIQRINTEKFVSLNAEQRLKWLSQNPEVKFSEFDNPNEGTLVRRLYGNKLALAEVLGDESKVEPFILETVAKGFELDLKKGISGGCFTEDAKKDMAPAAWDMAREALDYVKQEEEAATTVIQRAYREFRKLIPDMPGAWRSWFDAPAKVPQPPQLDSKLRDAHFTDSQRKSGPSLAWELL